MVETTGNVAVLRQGVDALAARGTVVVVGAPPFGTEVALDVNGMLAGKQVVGLTLGDSETQTLIPALVDLVRSGRMPIGRLVQQYPFADIGQAVADVAVRHHDQARPEVLSVPALQPSGNQGLGSWPWRRARMSPDAIAMRQGDRALTYTQLTDRAARLALVLRDCGVGRGDRVAYLGSNDLSTFEAFFASGLLGAVFVPLNTRLAAPEVAYMLTDCGARMLLVGHGVELVAKELAADEALAALQMAAAGDLADRIAAVPPLDEEVDVVLGDPALLLYTSGTTGRPKAATLTHGNLTWNTVNQLAHFDTASTDRALCISPLFHAVGLGQVTLPTFFKGGSIDVLAKFDAATVLRLVGAHGITSFAAVPTMLQLMVEDPGWSDADLSSLRRVVYGGSAVKESVARAWLDRGVQVLQGYGMTEASPGIYMALPERRR